MKLKEAIEIAKELGYNWIAVDDGSIYMYKNKPEIFCGMDEWCSSATSFIDGYYLAEYTGSKQWFNTRRKV